MKHRRGPQPPVEQPAEAEEDRRRRRELEGGGEARHPGPGSVLAADAAGPWFALVALDRPRERGAGVLVNVNTIYCGGSSGRNLYDSQERTVLRPPRRTAPARRARAQAPPGVWRGSVARTRRSRARSRRAGRPPRGGGTVRYGVAARRRADEDGDALHGRRRPSSGTSRPRPGTDRPSDSPRTPTLPLDWGAKGVIVPLPASAARSRSVRVAVEPVVEPEVGVAPGVDDGLHVAVGPGRATAWRRRSRSTPRPS